MNPSDIPIIINAKDRKSCLEAILGRLGEDDLLGQTIVLDTGSTYPPMLDYLNRLPCKLIRYLPKGPPQNAVWEADESMQRQLQQHCQKGEGWYVYTDCDVVPDCPKGWLVAFYETARCHVAYPKLGFGLRLDDLPDHYQFKAEVLAWEGQFWKEKINAAWYVASIDTTMALYRPGAAGASRALRSGPPYLARHLPWYYDSAHPTEEWLYYLEHMAPGVGHWSGGERSRRGR